MTLFLKQISLKFNLTYSWNDSCNKLLHNCILKVAIFLWIFLRSFVNINPHLTANLIWSKEGKRRSHKKRSPCYLLRSSNPTSADLFMMYEEKKKIENRNRKRFWFKYRSLDHLIDQGRCCSIFWLCTLLFPIQNKLFTGVNFINILRARLSYERSFF